MPFDFFSSSKFKSNFNNHCDLSPLLIKKIDIELTIASQESVMTLPGTIFYEAKFIIQISYKIRD